MQAAKSAGVVRGSASVCNIGQIADGRHRPELTSGVKTERGTRVQKKPRETQCVANLRMPK